VFIKPNAGYFLCPFLQVHMQIKGIFVFKPYQTGGESAGNKKEDSTPDFPEQYKKPGILHKYWIL